MKKRTIVLLAGAAALLLLVLFIGQARKPKEPSVQEQAEEMLARMDNAVAALEGDWKKQTVTKVSTLTYSNPEDDSTIIQYTCQSTYYDADPEEIEGVNLPALSSIQALEWAEDGRPCKVNELDALLFEKEARSYLCFTLSPEYTIVLEYSPDKVEEWEIFKMAESFSLPKEK